MRQHDAAALTSQHTLTCIAALTSRHNAAQAKYLAGLSAQLVARHGSQVPRTFAELEALPGVGHKTASVVMAQAFGVPAFPVDTHIWRLAMRWGLAPYNSNVKQVEACLKALFPEASWADLHLQIIFMGRQHCAAVRHDAASCPMCSWAGVEAPPALEGDSTPRKKGGAKAGADAALLATPDAVTPAKRPRKAAAGAPRSAARVLPVQP
jgi:endonuclease III